MLVILLLLRSNHNVTYISFINVFSSDKIVSYTNNYVKLFYIHAANELQDVTFTDECEITIFF